MPTWIVLRHGLEPDSRASQEPSVVGSVTARSELDARFAAHAWWMRGADDHLEMIPGEAASEGDRRIASGCRHLDLMQESERLGDVFGDRMVP